MAVIRSARQHPGIASIFMEYVRLPFTDRPSLPDFEALTRDDS
jgi:hypothetical protein